jgi:hypothetical protein
VAALPSSASAARYQPTRLGRADRDHAAVFRFDRNSQRLPLFPNYSVDARGFPTDPDPSRKLLLGWAAAPDDYENWLANRLMTDAAFVEKREPGLEVAVANPERDTGEAIGPAAWQFTGVYENTDVFLNLLRAAAGSYDRRAK